MIDAHLHLQDPRFAEALSGILETVEGLGIAAFVVNGTNPDDWEAVGHLATRCPAAMPCFGLHPWWVGSEREGWLAELEAHLTQHPDAGVGEIGLDRWIRGSDFDRQQEVFAAQLGLAERLDRPVSIHCLRAWGTMLGILESRPLRRGVLLHSYGGPVELVPAFVPLGAFFSISGYFFNPGKEGKLAVFDAVQPDRLLIESDAPDMLPPSEMRRYRLCDAEGSEINHPGNLASLYEAVASRYGWSLEETKERMQRNFEAWRGRG